MCPHKAQTGAYRAPGAPQATFALESTIDELSEGLCIDPIELRMKNAVEEGDLRGDNQPWPHLGLKLVLQRLKEHSAWQNRNKLNENEVENKVINTLLTTAGGMSVIKDVLQNNNSED